MISFVATMTVKEIIDLIPSELFEHLAVETQVDYQVKKLGSRQL
jgi:hypothetical protein